MTGKEAEKSIIEMFAAAAGIRSTVREVRDGVAEAKQAIQTVRADAAAKEREKIVEWIRQAWDVAYSDEAVPHLAIADAVGRGYYLNAPEAREERDG